MTKQHATLIMLALTLLLATTGTAIFAQEETPTVVPPPTFTDGRISDIVGLGGLALYCVDASGNTNVDSFEDGAITVWGVGDQKYIELTAEQLRGSAEVVQEPSVMEMEGELTVEAPEMMATEEMMTDEDAMLEATAVVGDPVLLARATTPSGEIGFFSLGNDQFALQGYDDKGAFFTYIWTSCNTGVVEHMTAPFLPFLEAPMMDAEMEMTPEATASS